MKPDQTHDTGPISVFSDATDPGPQRASATSERGVRLDESQARPPVAAHEAVTNPVDVERMILSLERSPRPPAPVPDERPSSDGGRFVAYGATGRPAQPHMEQEIRRQALAEMSVLVNATPVPPDPELPEARTARTSPQARGKTRAGGRDPRRDPRRDPGSRGVRAWAVWAVWTGTAAVLALGAVGLVVALSGYDGPQASAGPAASALVTPAGPSSPTVVLAMPAPEAIEEPMSPSSQAAPAPPGWSAPAVAPASSLAEGAARPIPGAAPAMDGPVEPPRPKKPPFEHW
jgi:hypothetical protein